MYIQRTIIASLALSLAACGGAVGPDGLESQQPAGKASQVGGGSDPAQLVFSRDDRPVDGDLVEIVLSQDALGTYDASLRRAFYDRLGGQMVDTTRELGTRLSCSFSAAHVACSRDQRPADGVLTELDIAEASAGRWDATLHTAWYDMIAGQPMDETETLASGLERQAPVAQALVFSRDQRPADGVLTEITIDEGQFGGKDVTLRTAWVDRFNGQPAENSETLGSGLSCDVGPNAIRCSRDDRPVDGVLTVVTLTRGADGWDVTLRTAWFDRINGQPVDQTDVIASRLIQR